MCNGFTCVFNLAWASACGAGEKDNPATAGEAPADSSVTGQLSVLSAVLPSHSDFSNSGYFIACSGDHVGIQTTSDEEDSHEGCHTRYKDSFLFSICSVRSWHCSSPASFRFWQPDSTGSVRLNVASGFLCPNFWTAECAEDPESYSSYSLLTPSSPQFSLPQTSSDAEYNYFIFFFIFYYR